MSRGEKKLEAVAAARLEVIVATLQELDELHRELAAEGKVPVAEQRLRNIMKRLRGEADDAGDQSQERGGGNG